MTSKILEGRAPRVRCHDRPGPAMLPRSGEVSAAINHLDANTVVFCPILVSMHGGMSIEVWNTPVRRAEGTRCFIYQYHIARASRYTGSYT